MCSPTNVEQRIKRWAAEHPVELLEAVSESIHGHRSGTHTDRSVEETICGLFHAGLAAMVFDEMHGVDTDTPQIEVRLIRDDGCGSRTEIPLLGGIDESGAVYLKAAASELPLSVP